MSKVFADIVKAKGGIRIKLWRSSDAVFTSEVLTLTPKKAEAFIRGLWKEIKERGIIIRDKTKISGR
jgi:hypothetical protein